MKIDATPSTSAAIKALLGLAPKTARRLRDDGGEDDIPLTHVHIGDRLRVRLVRADLESGRIDFVLGSPEFAARVTHGEIVREERKGKQPSDHAPVLVELL